MNPNNTRVKIKIKLNANEENLIVQDFIRGGFVGRLVSGVPVLAWCAWLRFRRGGCVVQCRSRCSHEAVRYRQLQLGVSGVEACGSAVAPRLPTFDLTMMSSVVN